MKKVLVAVVETADCVFRAQGNLTSKKKEERGPAALSLTTRTLAQEVNARSAKTHVVAIVKIRGDAAITCRYFFQQAHAFVVLMCVKRRRTQVTPSNENGFSSETFGRDAFEQECKRLLECLPPDPHGAEGRADQTALSEKLHRSQHL